MNTWLQKNMIKILSFFLLLGPIFDLITSISLQLFHCNIHIILFIKVLFIILLLYYSLFIYKGRNKKYVLFYYLLLGIYFIIYVSNILITKSIDVLFYECSYLFRTYFFSICLINIFLIYIDQKETISNKILVISFLEYLLLLFIPFITNTGFDSYAYSKVGSIGWFHSTNEIGGILSILFPITLSYLILKNKKIIPLLLLVFFYVIFGIGSKVPVLTTLITLLFFLILYLKKNPSKIKLLVLPLILLMMLGLYLFPKTNFYKNIQIHLDFLEIHTINDLLTFENIDHFIFSSRLKFLTETRTNYMNSILGDHFIGIGYIENYGTDEVNIKTIEMDYFDIFYRNGIIGFILFITPIVWILIQLKPNKVIERYALILALVLALFQGHILVSPSVSIYVIIILLNGGHYEKLLCHR